MKKLLSILIHIDKDDEQNLTTDLYSDETTFHTKLDWIPNTGVGWVNSDKENKWHAFTPKEFKGKRRVLIVNWCDKDTWNNKSQLYIGYKWYSAACSRINLKDVNRGLFSIVPRYIGASVRRSPYYNELDVH